jgi:flagellar hook protein FlgE
MSLGSALNASVSGLRGQSAAIAAVSENIANASTTAYKKRTINFESLITSSSAATATNQVGGGVTFDTSQQISEQGLIQNTGISTNIAINGQGFFVVTDDPTNQPSGFTYSRNGNFSTDENGLLINNEGMVLLGQRTDIDGVVTAANANDLNSLVPIDLDTISGTAGLTGEAEMDINLPSDAPIWAAPGLPGTNEYVTAVEIFDQLGNSLTVENTWRKTAVNTWVVEYSDPYLTSDATKTAVGTIDLDTVTAGTQSAIEVVFSGDGSINTIQSGAWGGLVFAGAGAAGAAAPFDIDITGLGLPTGTGANDMTFQMDIGTQGQFDGLTQFASSSNPPQLDIDGIEQDGVRFGQFSGVTINNDGLVTAVFDNGVRRPIFQIPVATFPNPEGLTNVRGTIYDENEQAGNYNLRLPTEGNAGNIEASSLELSTVDTSEEFNKMIVAQQAYSSAAQILSAVDDMFETLIGAVR